MNLPIPAPPRLEDARALVAGARAWIITDGKAGDESQCLGVAERLGLEAELRRVSPRAPFTWGMPWTGIDPAERPGRAGSALAPPFPDIAIASGRRAVAALRLVKRASGGHSLTVFLKDPRSGAGTADCLWVPEHDRLRGSNVLATLTSPHRFSSERLAAARDAAPAVLAGAHHPRVALLIGGDSRHHHFTGDDVARLVADIGRLAATGAFLMATASRRTPPALARAMAEIIGRAGGYFWDGTGENPYPALLALADFFVVTADSVNMAGEAAATGRPILLFTPSGGTGRITQFLSGLEQAGALRPFAGGLEGTTYDPIDSTPLIARYLAGHYAVHRRGLA